DHRRRVGRGRFHDFRGRSGGNGRGRRLLRRRRAGFGLIACRSGSDDRRRGNGGLRRFGGGRCGGCFDVVEIEFRLAGIGAQHFIQRLVVIQREIVGAASGIAIAATAAATATTAATALAA